MTPRAAFASIENGRALALRDVPDIELTAFGEHILAGVAEGMRVSALFATPVDPVPGGARASDAGLWLTAVLADDKANRLAVARARLVGNEFPSLTPRCPQVHLFEREIAEQYGVRPVGHPWLKPVRFHPSYDPRRDAWGRPAGTPPAPGITNFYAVAGDEVHEVAVGPVHAGIIEPGHFRFQCHGETVFHLEISLGYQHRGVERALIGGPDRRTIHYIETVAGDTTVGHTIAFARICEALSGTQKPARGQSWRGIALELERLANHTGDLGALAGDVGFLPTAAYCGRIRGDFLNMTALLCGNRFGRGLITPGGVRGDADEELRRELSRRLTEASADVRVAVDLLWSTPTVMARFEGTGAVDVVTAREIGMVGPAARASGVARDVRHDHPFGIYRFAQIPVSTGSKGDVFSRARVRWLEIQRSIAFILEQLDALPTGPVRTNVGALAGEQIAVSLVEGWRGEICHVAVTDAAGRFSRYKIVDPSFHNWMGLAVALRDQQISDFPLCNKSFNLSYCGHDL